MQARCKAKRKRAARKPGLPEIRNNASLAFTKKNPFSFNDNPIKDTPKNRSKNGWDLLDSSYLRELFRTPRNIGPEKTPTTNISYKMNKLKTFVNGGILSGLCFCSAQAYAQTEPATHFLPEASRQEAAFTRSSTQPPRATLELTNVHPSKNADSATIKFSVGPLDRMASVLGWEYGLLLDPDTALNGFILEGGYINDLSGLYSEADYKIPRTLQLGGFIEGESDSMTIAPGLYDALVLTISSSVPDPYVGSGDSFLDNLEFMAGLTYEFVVSVTADGNSSRPVFEHPIDLAISAISLPGSCGSTQVSPSLQIACGLMPLTDVQACFTIEGTGDTIRESVGDLASNSTMEFSFSNSLPSEKDKYNRVTAWLVPDENEYRTDNNRISARIFPHDPVTSPYVFDLDSGLYFLEEESWTFSYREGYIVPSYPDVSLYTRCIEMEAGLSYRLSLDFRAGTLDYMGGRIPEDWAILFGPSDQDISTWEVVFRDSNSIEEEDRHLEITVSPEETGVFAFAFHSYEGSGLSLTNIGIETLADLKMSILWASTGTPSMTPVEHFPSQSIYSVRLANRGRDSILNDTLQIFLAGEAFAKAPIPAIASGDTASMEIPLSFEPGTLQNPVIVSALALHGPDTLALQHDTIRISTDMIAYDRVSPAMYEDDGRIIIAFSEIECGLDFHLLARDTVTGISLGLNSYGMTPHHRLHIYAWDEATHTLGRSLCGVDITAVDSIGFHTYPIPPMVLDSGSYLVSVHMGIGDMGFGMITDGSPYGHYYSIAGGQAYRGEGLGFPAIRLETGEGSIVHARDAAVQSFTAPTLNEAIFTANETISVQIANLGFDTLSSIPVFCRVNGTVVDTQSTTTVLPYGSEEVSFTADLSQTDTTYEICVFTGLENDEDASNDSLRTILVSPEPADPYTLDFERCPDFTTTWFNPIWKSVDRDLRAPSYEFSGFDFPHSGEAFGFIVFNPASTSPAMTDDNGEILPEMAPHAGERYGATFSNPNQNDDWLISPRLAIGENMEVELYARSYAAQRNYDRFRILASSTTGNPEDFSTLLEAQTTGEWQRFSADLSSFAGKEIHVAIQVLSENAFVFMVDDIAIKTANSNGKQDPVPGLTVSPNPASDFIEIRSEVLPIRHIRILDMKGYEIHSSSRPADTHVFRYDVSGLATGIYLAVIETANGSKTLKFIVR